jgi:GAF domain-containing protein/HAMP domain-containing protein
MAVYATDPTASAVSFSNAVIFQDALQGYTVYSPIDYNAEINEASFQLALPVLDQDNVTVGVLLAHIGAAELNAILAAGLSDSQSGEVLLFSETGVLLSPSRYAFQVGTAYPLSINLSNAIASRRAETIAYTSYRGESVMGSYGWFQPLGAMLVAEEALFEARLPMLQGVLTTAGVILFALVAALAAAWYASTRIALPINHLAQTASAIAAGNLNLVVAVEQQDEIGDLARVFNSMTAQLSGQLAQLEARVAERTQELERRSAQLQVAAEVARDASSTQDFDLLIQQAVDLVRERFGFYHAGLFLLDEAGEYAVLRAATGEAGQRMVARGHQLKLGQEGMVGFVAARGLSRIALDVGDEATYFRNPDLPLTRSEMALSLKVGARVIGVLDVQSEKERAFTQEDVVILQTMADQLAVAIENARLLNEVQASLQQVERMYSSYSQQSWQRIVSARELHGYEFVPGQGVAPLSPNGVHDPTSGMVAHVPLRVRGLAVGNLRVYPGDGGWSEEQQALLTALGERISQALESARLYEESQQRAANEQVSNAITARMRATMDADTVLQTTIREIQRAFELQEVEIWLNPTPDIQKETSPELLGDRKLA